MSLTLQDSFGILWKVSANSLGQITVTQGSVGTTPQVIINDPNEIASWIIGITTAGVLTVTSTTLGAYPTQFSLSNVFNLRITPSGLLQVLSASVINDLSILVLDRLEESRSNPKFWNVQDEIYNFILEAMNEASLITGEPQNKFLADVVFNQPLVLPANQTLIDLSKSTPIFGMMRLESGGVVKKTTLWDMDRMLPGWENDTGNAGDLPDYWFPIGINRFAIHPQLSAPVSVIVSGIVLPVPVSRPLTGNEIVDFQNEYFEAFVDYAAHIAALKEGTKEFTDSIKVYDRFLSKMEELSKFAMRKGSLRFSRTLGAPSKVTPVEQR